MPTHMPPQFQVADEVKSFYDRYPYPRPVTNLDDYRRRWSDLQRRRADYHLFWPYKSFREDLTILVAGCGTSQAAKYALRWPNATVIGIDVSATSMNHTRQLKQTYSLNNLKTHQLAIEDVGELGIEFDYIVSTGVLDHLADPDMGLRALRDVLKSDGAMHLMVYARYGRTGIYMMQEFCRRLGIGASDHEISDLVAAIRELPPGHPMEYLLRVARDFENGAEIADALLHPRDRAYSVPQIFDFIEKAGLVFGRWVRQAPYDPHCGIISGLPQYGRLCGLPVPEQYAAVELFRGTMVRHNLVVYPQDTPLPSVSFQGDAWLGYVPICVPGTICVQERLPKDAAAVLINPAHIYSDIYLPISTMEKALFDAIAGKRSIAHIVKGHFKSSEKIMQVKARSFFEKLWLHDQVVFDASPTVAKEEVS